MTDVVEALREIGEQQRAIIDAFDRALADVNARHPGAHPMAVRVAIMLVHDLPEPTDSMRKGWVSRQALLRTDANWLASVRSGGEARRIAAALNAARRAGLVEPARNREYWRLVAHAANSSVTTTGNPTS